MILSLEGKNAIVCGSSQGIGFAIAEELALMGANCILLARNEENLKLAAFELDISIRQTHSYHVIDFNDHLAVKKLIQTITAQHPIHILVNNSGGPAAGPIIEATEEQFLQAFNQHLIVNHILTMAVIDGMKKEGYGRIVNIISTSVKVPLKGLGVSNTIRGAVASWAKTMSIELAPFGITVNNVLPGATATGRLDAIINNKTDKTGNTRDEITEEMLHEIPAGRFASPEEIGAMVAFL